MATATERRRQRFLKALAATRLTQAGWAAAHGISKGHLSLVLSGKRESGTLTETIDTFIEKHLGSQAALAS